MLLLNSSAALQSLLHSELQFAVKMSIRVASINPSHRTNIQAGLEDREQDQDERQADPESRVKAPNEIAESIRSIAKRLKDTEEDRVHRLVLAGLGLNLEEPPAQYIEYFKNLLIHMVASDPYDPWIHKWVNARRDDLRWNFLWNHADSPTELGLDDDHKDAVSFGKRASVMDFAYDVHKTSSRITLRSPIRVQPTVAEVIDVGSIFSKPPSDNIRWIHLPANNMSWLEESPIF